MYVDDGCEFCRLLPFGVGRRSCVAEVFARARIFMLITTLFQQFDISIVNPDEFNSDPRLYANEAAITTPDNVLVTFKPRV